MTKRAIIVQYGLGQVGRALVRQILAGREALAARRGLELRHAALADSTGCLVGETVLSDAELQQALTLKERGTGLRHQPGGEGLPLGLPASCWGADLPVILVDVTAAEGMEAVALEALQAGWGVVLANKRPLAGDLEAFRRLTSSCRLRWEATVGAGLPWIEALSHLLDTGDRVLRLEAAVSGTLGFLTSQLEAGVPLSAAVAEARARGYTEPDPRDDLSAADVRRKALILARMLGLAVSWEDVPAEPLYPLAWGSLSIDEFMAELPGLDRAYAERMAQALAVGHTLRYSVELQDGRCAVGLHEVEKDSPLGALQGPDCLLAIYSERYHPAPLVISGPGAGAEVTAAGVYADMIGLALEMHTGS